jgi:rhodanese-related sulfurtransferase
MPITLNDMMEAARAAVPKIAPQDAMQPLACGEALALDVRDDVEVRETGRVKGALNVPRSRLEFAADPASPYHNAALRKDRTILVYCNSGGRAALAGKTLKDMGFGDIRLLGGFQDWIDAGGAMEP